MQHGQRLKPSGSSRSPSAQEHSHMPVRGGPSPVPTHVRDRRLPWHTASQMQALQTPMRNQRTETAVTLPVPFSASQPNLALGCRLNSHVFGAARRDLRSADVFRPEDDQDARRADLERLLAADRGSISWDDEVTPPQPMIALPHTDSCDRSMHLQSRNEYGMHPSHCLRDLKLLRPGRPTDVLTEEAGSVKLALGCPWRGPSLLACH